ncbi:MAG: glycosyltransferase family 4 protein [Candidatus Aenigmarchaeota archaeon]|nr:glycosyltransferase family 4 protein [Candidatus Aenigmarchaeota archaeon]
MQICMLSELFYPYLLGGAERRYYEIAVRLAKRHNVTVYSLRFDGHEDREEHRGVQIVRTGSSHPLDKRSVPALATFILALPAAAAAGNDIIDANQGISSFAGLLKPLTRKPVVATFHDLYWNQWNEYFPFPLSSLGKSMEFMWSRLPYDAVIANSPTTAKKLGFLGFSDVTTIPSGVDIDFINRIRVRKRKNTVTYVGRLVKYKNVDALIRAVKEISAEIDVKLRIVGSGPEEYNLKKLARDLGVDAVFSGFVSEQEKFRIIKSSSVLVNPSSVEGLGLVLIESMAAGTPVVAKNLEAYFFCNGRNALLYDNETELASRILDAMTKKNLVKNGHETAKKYSWDSVARSVESLYRRLAE